jgi:hypothetical protein
VEVLSTEEEDSGTEGIVIWRMKSESSLRRYLERCVLKRNLEMVYKKGKTCEFR